MIALLILDIGLAAAGAMLLSKGLADDDASSDAKAEPTPVEKKSEAPASAPPAAAAPAQAAAATPSRAAAPAPSPIAAAPARSPVAAAAAPAAPTSAAAPKPAARKDATKQRDDKKGAAAPVTAPSAAPAVTDRATDKANDKANDATLVPAVPSEPQDPYPAADTEREIDAAAARSKASFDRCAADHGPVQGRIEIAFQVKPDGRVANAAAVDNSTGNAELARCLVAEVSSWRVSAHGGAVLNMSRPFTYR